MYSYRAKLIKVIDGDTIDFVFDLGMKVFIKERVRLYGVDTPETFGVKRGSEEYKKGMQSKAFVKEFLRDQDIWVETIKDKTGKYGRYLAKVYIGRLDDDGLDICLNDELVKNGLAEEKDY